MRVIDPPSGWMYGFPKVLPSNIAVGDFLLISGYPKKDIPFALKHMRYWEVHEDDIEEQLGKEDI